MARPNSFRSALEKVFLPRLAPWAARLPAYLELTRFDRPVGIFLLLWPTMGALWIAAEGLPDFDLLVIFVLGTVIMRAAGCAINDFADYRIDGHVGRTKTRPLARGALTRRDAMKCFAVLSTLGFALVLLTNAATIGLALAAVPIIAVYPLMKRVTHLPQLVLGVAFSWGIPMAFTAQTAAIPAVALLLFAANVLWTIAYDTQYAMVDREFDRQIGVKSTAILFDRADRMLIGLLQLLFLLVMWFAGNRLGLGIPYLVGLMVAAGLLAYQQFLIRDRSPQACFRAFLNNNRVGAAIFAGIFLSYW